MKTEVRTAVKSAITLMKSGKGFEEKANGLRSVVTDLVRMAREEKSDEFSSVTSLAGQDGETCKALKSVLNAAGKIGVRFDTAEVSDQDLLNQLDGIDGESAPVQTKTEDVEVKTEEPEGDASDDAEEVLNGSLDEDGEWPSDMSKPWKGDYKEHFDQ